MNLTDAKTAFLEYLKTQGKSLRTLYTYGKDLDYLINFFGKERTLESLRAIDIGKFFKSKAYLNTSAGKTRSARSLAKNERTIRQLLIWTKEQGWIPSLPLPKSVSLGRQQTQVSEGED